MAWKMCELYSYLGDYISTLHKTEVTDINGEHIDLPMGIKKSIMLISELMEKGKTLRFIGNGGSAGISMHQCTDFFRTCGTATDSLFDPTLLTCMANDLGYDNVFAEPIRIVSKSGDGLVAISSGGTSKNILEGVAAARKKKCFIITMSGFDADNPLRKAGDINFYVSSNSYRFTESAHMFLCNWILDFLKRDIDGGEINAPLCEP